MSEPTNVDLVKGFDFTGVNPGTAADHNTLVDSARPFAESNPLEGKGFIITTQDDNGNVPFVPDATSTNQNWKRYLWQRLSNSGTTRTKIYKWDENVAPDVTFLKWQELGSTTDLQAAITSIEADIVVLQNTQANQATQLNATAAIANAAAADAASALSGIPDVSSLTQAVTVTLPAADAVNASAAAAALAAANAAQSSANAAAVNAGSVANTKFYSSSTAVPANGFSTLIDEAHGLGGVPHFVRFVVECTSIDQNYAVGDQIELSQVTTTAGTPAFSFGCNATNIFIIQNSAASPPKIIIKNTGVVNNMNILRWVVRAFLWKGY